jgi:hypothetical protein
MYMDEIVWHTCFLLKKYKKKPGSLNTKKNTCLATIEFTDSCSNFTHKQKKFKLVLGTYVNNFTDFVTY